MERNRNMLLPKVGEKAFESANFELGGCYVVWELW